MKMNARGFSLIEIMMVVAIMGVIATMAAGSFTSWLKRETFADQKATLYEMLTRARNMANSRDECAKVTVTSQSISVQGYQQGTGANCADPMGNPTINFQGTIKTGYTLENFDNGSDFIVFNSTGGLREGTVVKIFMKDPSGVRQGFQIYPALGQIRAVNN